MSKANDEIVLSETHGVNPSIEVCVVCEEDLGIILFGKLKDDVEAPKQVCLGRLCDKCISKFKKEHKKLILEVNDLGFTGRYFIFPEKCIRPEILEEIGDNVTIYLGEEAFQKILQNVEQ